MANDDQMENEWGIHLVNISTNKLPKKTIPEFDRDIKRVVKGFQLQNCLSSGTNANQDAMLLATDNELGDALFAQGSYLGGNSYMQKMSTTMYSPAAELSVPKYPENASAKCIMQTVALPHFVDCRAFSQQARNEHEDHCLRQLHMILVMAKLAGKPKRALLLELMLGGNGGQLSDRFLAKLGVLLKKFEVTVVVDEVLTGGRVGPAMTMTENTPPEFFECVEYITMGKFMHCALILKKRPNRPTRQDPLRGTSTSQSIAEPAALWNKVTQMIEAGVIPKRRQQVLKKMKLKDGSEDVWGKGLFMVSSKKRPGTYKGLKNRCLPMMELTSTIKTLSCLKSKWNRSSVTQALYDGAIEWMDAQNDLFKHSPETAFIYVIVQYIFSGGCYIDGEFKSEETGQFRFRTEDVLKFYGRTESSELARTLTEGMKAAGTKCKKDAPAFIRSAVLKAVVATKGCNSMYKKRKTSARIEFNFVKSSLFGQFECGSQGNRFWT
ncbi:MAG: hypothetical protein SGILL_003696 [Bacillariaceae sp.]